MVAKKKPGAAQSVEESVSETKPERRAPVTQVVEVVEEVDDTPSSSSASLEDQVEESPKPAHTQPETMHKEPVEVPPSSEPEEEQSSEPVGSDEKRRELVDELFQKRIDKPANIAPEITFHTQKKKSKPAYVWAVGIITACVVIGLSLVVLGGKGVDSVTQIVKVSTPTPSPTTSPTPSPTPVEMDKTKISIQVLNGGGERGAATKMKQALEDKGYTVSDTGNADEFTFEKSKIIVKKTFAPYIPMLEKDLSGDYTLDKSESTLDDASDYDVQVIVGKE